MTHDDDWREAAIEHARSELEKALRAPAPLHAAQQELPDAAAINAAYRDWRGLQGYSLFTAGYKAGLRAAPADQHELGKAGWLAQMVIDKLGGTNDLPAWVRQSAEYYRQALEAAAPAAPREPTEAMIDAGWKAYYATATPAMMPKIWRAMYDASAQGKSGEDGEPK